MLQCKEPNISFLCVYLFSRLCAVVVFLYKVPKKFVTYVFIFVMNSLL